VSACVCLFVFLFFFCCACSYEESHPCAHSIADLEPFSAFLFSAFRPRKMHSMSLCIADEKVERNSSKVNVKTTIRVTGVSPCERFWF
jgi:hypothetical protein